MAKKPKKPLTEAQQLEVDLLQEIDLGRLQRQYEIAEKNRKSFNEESGSKLAKQRRVIRILKKEHRNVMTDLEIATSSTKKRQDAQVSDNLNNLLEEHDNFDAEIKQDKTHLNELDYQINKVEKVYVDMRSKQITDVQFQARILAGEKSVEALENKLDTAVKKFCIILTDNRKLREQIDHLLKERAHFNILWERLISNLYQGKKFMLDLIEQATLAYDQREEWCTKLQALRMRAHKDLIIHTEEMRELHRRLDHDGKLEDFLGVKSQMRVMRDLEEKERRKRQIAREKMERLLERYKQMLEEIKEFCQETDIEKLAEQFLKQEEENFALFNYVNELNREMEDLSDSLTTLQIKIDDQRAVNEQRTLHQSDKLENLQEKLDEMTALADHAQEELDIQDATLQTLLSGIDRLFKLCKCSNTPLLELLGDNTKVNNYNALLHLEILEKSVNDLIISVYYKEKTDKRKQRPEGIINEDRVKMRLTPVEKFVPTNPCPLCVEQEQVSDVIDVLQFALSRDEVMDKLEKRLQLPDGLERLHNVSACHLPKSRQIIQRRYQ